MANEIINSNTLVRRLDTIFIVRESNDKPTYDAVIAGTYELPDYSFVALTSATEETTVKLCMKDDTWDSAIPVSIPS